MIDWERIFLSLTVEEDMNEQAISIFCICDEIVKFFGLEDDPQCKMSTAEIMTFALISASHYRGDYRTTRLASISCKYFPKILSLSRLLRRIHKIQETIWWMVFKSLQIYLRKTDPCASRVSSAVSEHIELTINRGTLMNSTVSGGYRQNATYDYEIRPLDDCSDTPMLSLDLSATIPE